MNANIVRLPQPPARAEQRRKATLRDMRCSLQALGLELERIGTLGNAQAATALQNWADRIEHQKGRAETLAEEFAELAESDSDENIR